MNKSERLKKLFSYQKFANNPELAKEIKETLGQEARELLDEYLYGVTGGKKENADDKNKSGN